MWSFKRCEHEWYQSCLVGVENIYGDEHTEVYIYCPKCDKRRKVRPYQWSIIDGEQKVKQRYRGDINDQMHSVQG